MASCTALTQRGRRCRNKAKQESLCLIHLRLHNPCYNVITRALPPEMLAYILHCCPDSRTFARLVRSCRAFYGVATREMFGYRLEHAVEHVRDYWIDTTVLFSEGQRHLVYGKQGLWRMYDEEGKITNSVEYAKGVRHGVYTCYCTVTGVVLLKVMYRDDERVGSKLFQSDGTLRLATGETDQL